MGGLIQHDMAMKMMKRGGVDSSLMLALFVYADVK